MLLFTQIQNYRIKKYEKILYNFRYKYRYYTVIK